MLEVKHEHYSYKVDGQRKPADGRCRGRAVGVLGGQLVIIYVVFVYKYKSLKLLELERFLMSNLAKRFSLSMLIGFMAIYSYGCNQTEDISEEVSAPKSIEEQQIDSCIKDIQRTLNDPNSIEILSHRGIELKDGTFRIAIEYTAMNRMGGRERNEEACGFKSKDSAEWNPDDIINQLRDMSATLNRL
jgi:hypothetical protein